MNINGSIISPSDKIGLREIALSEGPVRMKIIKALDWALGSVWAFFQKARPPQEGDITPQGNILIIRPGGIGDAVFLLPFLRVLRQKYPAFGIDVLCEKRNAEIFSSQKDLCREVYCYDDRAAWREMLKNQYDIVVDTEQWHYLTAWLARRWRPRILIGFASRLSLAKLFDHAVFYDEPAYELENFQRLFSAFGPEFSKELTLGGAFCVQEESRAWAREFISEKSVCLFVGASIPARRFSAEQILEIARAVIEKGFGVIFLGGGDVVPLKKILRGNLEGNAFYDFIGETTLTQSAALIEHSRLFIGPDSGLMHLACAVKTPVIAVFGPGQVPKWGPRPGQGHAIRRELACSPCTRFGYTITTCRREYPCMAGLVITELLNKIQGD